MIRNNISSCSPFCLDHEREREREENKQPNKRGGTLGFIGTNGERMLATEQLVQRKVVRIVLRLLEGERRERERGVGGIVRWAF